MPDRRARRILVTGGCGFVGSHLVRCLLDEGAAVVNLDLLTYAGRLTNVVDVADDPGYAFVHGDIADADDVARAAAGCDAIVNVAAETHVDRSLLGGDEFVRTNVLGTKRLLDWVVAHPGTRFVQVSTDEVYGDVPRGRRALEDDPLAPSSPYAAAKAGADLLVLAAVRTYGVDASIVRGANAYGPNQFPEKLIPLFITNLMHDEPVPVYGDGQQIRDWIHVLDHCSGVEAAWRKGTPGEGYNFGGRCEKTNLDLTFTLLDLLGKPRTLIRYVKDRPGHDRRYAIDCSKAERELGWRPEWTFEKGIQDTIAWYRSNQAWIDGIKNKDYLSYYEKQYGKL
jgi:dTDP-glucose 4,6-dehydratase